MTAKSLVVFCFYALGEKRPIILALTELYAIEAEIRGRLDRVAEENAVETCGDGEGVRLYPESLECAERVLS